MSNLDRPTPESLLGIDSFETIPRFVAKVETVVTEQSDSEQKDNSLESTIKGGFSKAITKSDPKKHPHDESKNDVDLDAIDDSGDPLIGEMFGHFRIESVIASGGMQYTSGLLVKNRVENGSLLTVVV